MGGQSVAKWIKQQEKAFTGWVNAHLQTRSMYVDSLQKDIARVSPLIHLLKLTFRTMIISRTIWPR